MRVYACLLGLITYRESLPARILRVVSALIQKGLKDSKDMNHEQSTSMAATRTETTRGLTCSVSRVIEVTAWQSVDAVCFVA